MAGGKPGRSTSQHHAGGPGKSPAMDALDTLGTNGVIERILDGESLTGIGESVGVSFGSVQTWIKKDPERSAQADEARRLSARKWDEKAESELRAAQDPFELAKARELAHHFRWRASKIDKAIYGDKQAVELTGKDGGPIRVAEELTDAELARIAAGSGEGTD